MGAGRDQLGKSTATLAKFLAAGGTDETIASAQTLRPPDPVVPEIVGDLLRRRPAGTLAPIEVDAPLAEGGMGVVCLARQGALGRSVVVKSPHSGSGEEAAARLLREAWVTGSLEHPNIVPVHDVRIDDAGQPQIVLKRIEGETWTSLLRAPEAVKSRFGASDPLEWHLDILRQVGQAVRFAHSRGILHRDLKPDNVMIGEFGEVYLVDWGIAVALTEEARGKIPLASEAREMAGTPSYMAPEMLGDSPLDERTDVYLLGAVLYEVLSGRAPHRPGRAIDMIAQISRSEPEMPPGAPAAMITIVEKAMAREPRDRFASVNELLRALQEARERLASERLASESDQLLARLRHLIERGDDASHELYRAYGALRFGLTEALRTWPENPRAKVTLERAVQAMIDYQLARGDARAADAILAELAQPPAHLEERVALALQTTQEERADYRRLLADQDLSLGSRTRWFLFGILGFLWVIVPMAGFLFDQRNLAAGPERYALSTLFFLFLGVSLWWWARESINKTRLNRGLAVSLLVLFMSNLVLCAAVWLATDSAIGLLQIALFEWMVITGMVTALLERRALPAAVGYAAGTLIAFARPEITLFVMSAANFAMLVNAFIIWYPRKQDYGDRIFTR